MTSVLARPWWQEQVLNNGWTRVTVSAAAVAAVVKTKATRPKPRKGPKKGNVEDLTQWPTEESILDFLNSQASKNPHTLARALRHCGRQGWWQVLMEANALQQATGFQISIFASACADALRTSKGKKARKRDEAIDFLEEMWRKLDLRKNKVQELQYALSSSLNLCKEVSTPKALSLADELWEWFEEKEVPKNGVLFESYLRLQESQGHFDSVNDLLMRIMVEQDIKANDRTLVDLLELAAQRRDSKRADDLWHILVDSLDVEPNVFATAALAKAHFMAGRLRYAEELLASEAQGKTMSQRLCNEYLQILLILCHAAPTPANFQKASDFIESKAIVRRDGGAKNEWSKMTSLLQQMKTKESALSKPLRLHHILVTKNSQRSMLMYWTDHEMGAQYVE